MQYVLQVVLLILGFAMLWKGADWFVDGASNIATKFKIPQIVIGLTIVAMGTSAPEATVSIMSSIQGKADLAVGNVLGSNLFNVLIILGLSALVFPLIIKKDTVYIEIPYVILITFLIIIMGLDGNISRLDGIILLLCFIIYLTYLFFKAKNEREEIIEPVKQKPIWLSILFTIIGLACIIFGSRFVIDSATFFAEKLGISDRLIALTIVAFGTSLPELFTSVAASRKKNPDIAIGNIIGSNIFNVVFVLTLASIVKPLPYSQAFTLDSIFALASPLLLLLLTFANKKLTRFSGVILLLSYVVYFIILL